MAWTRASSPPPARPPSRTVSQERGTGEKWAKRNDGGGGRWARNIFHRRGTRSTPGKKLTVLTVVLGRGVGLGLQWRTRGLPAGLVGDAGSQGLLLQLPRAKRRRICEGTGAGWLSEWSS